MRTNELKTGFRVPKLRPSRWMSAIVLNIVFRLPK